MEAKSGSPVGPGSDLRGEGHVTLMTRAAAGRGPLGKANHIHVFFEKLEAMEDEDSVRW